MVRLYIRKLVIFIWLRMCWDTKNVNTTRKHYAAMKEDNKRKAARIVQLREKE